MIIAWHVVVAEALLTSGIDEANLRRSFEPDLKDIYTPNISVP